VKDVELLGLEESRTPGTGMILRMPTAALRITASDGRSIYLPYSMLKGQVREIADLVSDKSGSKAPGRPRTG
jgi:hypothetical protein